MTTATGNDTTLTVTAGDTDSELGSVFDWVNWPAGQWVDTSHGAPRVIDLPQRFFAIKMQKMLIDGQAAAVFEALTLPMLGGTPTVTAAPGDTGEAQLVRDNLLKPGIAGGMSTPFDVFLAQMAAAVAYKRAYFEKVWTRNSAGQVVYAKLAWRPQGASELIRDLQTGEVAGFRQYMDFGLRTQQQRVAADRDGYVEIPARRAVVYVHGQRRNPVDGMSSMESAYWAWEMKQRALGLWLSYCDDNAVPKVVAYGKDSGEARKNAQSIARLKSGGVAPAVKASDPTDKPFDILNLSSQGGAEYRALVTYLDQMMTHSVLAGFLDLTSARGTGGGSSSGRGGATALSKDQSDLFLESRHTVLKEMTDCINTQVVAPLVQVNFAHKGDAIAVPSIDFTQASTDVTEKAMGLLQELITAPNLDVPAEFLVMLLEKAAAFLDLDPDKVATVLENHVKETPPTAPPKPGAAPAGGKAADGGGLDMGDIGDFE